MLPIRTGTMKPASMCHHTHSPDKPPDDFVDHRRTRGRQLLDVLVVVFGDAAAAALGGLGPLAPAGSNGSTRAHADRQRRFDGAGSIRETCPLSREAWIEERRFQALGASFVEGDDFVCR